MLGFLHELFGRHADNRIVRQANQITGEKAASDLILRKSGRRIFLAGMASTAVVAALPEFLREPKINFFSARLNSKLRSMVVMDFCVYKPEDWKTRPLQMGSMQPEQFGFFVRGMDCEPFVDAFEMGTPMDLQIEAGLPLRFFGYVRYWNYMLVSNGRGSDRRHWEIQVRMRAPFPGEVNSSPRQDCIRLIPANGDLFYPWPGGGFNPLVQQLEDIRSFPPLPEKIAGPVRLRQI